MDSNLFIYEDSVYTQNALTISSPWLEDVVNETEMLSCDEDSRLYESVLVFDDDVIDNIPITEKENLEETIESSSKEIISSRIEHLRKSKPQRVVIQGLEVENGVLVFQNTKNNVLDMVLAKSTDLTSVSNFIVVDDSLLEEPSIEGENLSSDLLVSDGEISLNIDDSLPINISTTDLSFSIKDESPHNVEDILDKDLDVIDLSIADLPFSIVDESLHKKEETLEDDLDVIDFTTSAIEWQISYDNDGNIIEDSRLASDSNIENNNDTLLSEMESEDSPSLVETLSKKDYLLHLLFEFEKENIVEKDGFILFSEQDAG